MKPLAIDLFCGLGGWTEGLLAAGFEVVGFDNEQHVYGEHRYPAQLVLQDVRTLHGSQFKDAALIVASSPCQEFSYRAMPWKRAKALGPPELGMELFAQAARIQREASESAGHHIPMIQENVRGAQKYVGRAAWHYGSYFLWGDVPALMPVTHGGVKALGVGSWYPPNDPRHTPGLDYTRRAGEAREGVKVGDLGWGKARGGIKPEGYKGGSFTDSVKHSAPGPRKNGKGSAWFGSGPAAHGSKSNARKAASARIAKIPFPLALHIARTYYPG